MADYQSKFSGIEVDAVVRRLLNWANAGYTTAFNNLTNEEWSTYDNITISTVEYAVLWHVAPTAENQVYGYGMHKQTGRLYQIYSNHGTYTATALDANDNTLNTTGATNNTTDKLYLIGAKTQGDNPITYSHSKVYEQSGKLYSDNREVLTAHPTISVSSDTTSALSPAPGETFSAVDSITRDGNGHVTAINTKTVTLPADADTKVIQNYSTNNNNYPLLATATSGTSSTNSRGATTAIVNNLIYVNPSTGAIYANLFYKNNKEVATLEEVDNKIAALGDLLEFKGTKSEANIKALTSASKGDVWLDTATGFEWICVTAVNGTANANAWEQIGKNGAVVIDAGYEPLRTGYTTNGKVYAVEKDSNNKMFVSIPWENNTHNSHGVTVISGKKADGTTDITASSSQSTSGLHSVTLADSGVISGAYGDTSEQTPGYGSTFKVPSISVNAKGIVTAVGEHTVKIPASDNTNQTIKADSKTFGANAIVELVGGTNVTLAGDTTNNKITINSPDTHYTNYLQIKGNGTEAIKYTQNADKSLNIKPGSNITVSAASGEITISGTANTATAADDILDGSNSGTEVKYAPYASQQNKLSFDTSAVNPTNTTRLNLNGKFYATEVYSAGNKVLTAHPTIGTESDSTTSPSQLGYGGTFTAITSATRDSNGHITTLNTATYTLPAEKHNSHAIISGVKSDGSTNITGSASAGNITLGDSGVLASGTAVASYGDSGNQTPNYGATFKVPYLTVNSKGIVVGISEHTVKIPASDNSHNSHSINSGKQADGTTNIISTASSTDLTLGDSGATAGAYGDSSAQTPGYGATFKVPYIKVNAKGIVTEVSEHTVKIPASDEQNDNQKIKVGSTTFDKNAEINLVAGSNVSITPATTGNGAPKITIAATNTTYSSKAAASGGTDVSLVTTGEKYTWNNKQNALSAQTAYTSKGSATKVPQITTNSWGQVTGITEVTITQPTVNNGKLTIKANGTQKGTFTANQSGDTTVDITAADLGLTSAMKFVGTSTTDPGAGAATVEGISAFSKGNVVIYKRSGETHYEEYINVDGSNAVGSWELLGDADSYALAGHTHNYAGSSSAGGAATSANKLNTNAGSTTQPVYFANGVPVATTYSLAKSVPADAKFTDTTYESKSAAQNGTAVSLVTTGEKYTWNNKSNLTLAGNGSATTASRSDHTHSQYLTSHQTVSSDNNTATYGGTVVVGTVGGTELKFTMPASDNTWRPVGTGATDAAAGNHTHTTTLAKETSADSSLTLAYGTKYKLSAGGTSYVFTMPATDNTNYYHTRVYSSGLKISTGTGISDMYVPSASTSQAGVLKIGTTASDAAAGNHTHTTSLATDTGTSTVSLAYGGKYKLTAGGNSVIFTMPAADNTNYYHTRAYSSGLKISTGTGVSDMYVPTATTTQSGVITLTQGNLNTMINQLDTGSSTPVDADYYVSQYVGGGSTTTTYHRRPMSKLYEYVKGKLAVSSSAPSASWGGTVTVGSVGGTNLQFKMPSNPNTHYTATLVAGASNATANVSSNVSDPYVHIFENSAKSSSLQIKGAGSVSVKSNNGIITITGASIPASITSGSTGDVEVLQGSVSGDVLTLTTTKLSLS